MNYEQKYKEALERAKDMMSYKEVRREDLEYIFPELKESEGEKIRKQVSDIYPEQKDFAPKVEPKFKVGNWVVENEPNNYARFIQILEIVNVQGKDRYRISRDIHNDEDIVDFDFVEKYYHKFDIKDARDGDVLASGEVVFIFEAIYGVWLYCHCSAHKDGSFNADSYNLLTDKYFGEVQPATKEQHDLLFQKMNEAGYEWDVENMVLKKL